MYGFVLSPCEHNVRTTAEFVCGCDQGDIWGRSVEADQRESRGTVCLIHHSPGKLAIKLKTFSSVLVFNCLTEKYTCGQKACISTFMFLLIGVNKVIRRVLVVNPKWINGMFLNGGWLR